MQIMVIYCVRWQGKQRAECWTVKMEFLSVECEGESHSTTKTTTTRRRVTRRPRDRWTVVVGPEIRYVWSELLQLPASHSVVTSFDFYSKACALSLKFKNVLENYILMCCSVETTLHAGQFRVRIPVRKRDFSFLQNIQTSFGSHTVSYWVATVVLSRGWSGLGLKIIYSLSSNVKVKKEWSLYPLPSHAFMAWTKKTLPLYISYWILKALHPLMSYIFYKLVVTMQSL
jgi:hypothetical protein